MENLRNRAILFILVILSAFLIVVLGQPNSEGSNSQSQLPEQGTLPEQEGQGTLPEGQEQGGVPGEESGQSSSEDSVSSVCKAIPYNHATPCLSTCQTCPGLGFRKTCSSCPSDLNFSTETSECVVPSGSIYFQESFFQDEDISMDGEIEQFYTSNGLLTEQDISILCIAGLYKFQIAGLFYANEVVVHDVEFSSEIDSISLNFRLFATTEFSKVTIEINNKVLYYEVFHGGELDIEFDPTTNPPTAVLESDPSEYLDSVFVPVHTGLLPLEGFSAEIKITANTPSSMPCWGFSELTISGRKCATCVSREVKMMQKVLGIIIGITASILVVSMSLVFLHNFIAGQNKKSKLHQRIQKIMKDSQQRQEQYERYRASCRQISIRQEELTSENSKQNMEGKTEKSYWFF